MPQARFAASLLVASLLALSATAQAQVTPELDVQTHEASGLRYHVVPPPGWDGEAPVDMLVALHGSGGKIGDFYRIAKILVPELRRHLQVYVQSPTEVGWPVSACEGLGAIAREVKAQHPVRSVLLFGFSAGGWVGTEALFQNADVFEGALVAGATVYRTPPTEAAIKRRYLYFSIGSEDAAWKEMGLEEADPTEITKHFAGSGWDPEHYAVDLVEGGEHTLLRESLNRGLAWLLDRLRAEAPPLSDVEQATIQGLDALAEAGDADAIRAAVTGLLARPGDAARAAIYPTLEALAKRRDLALAEVGTDLLGQLGDPRAGPFLAKRVDRVRRLDAGLYRRTIRALGDCSGEEAEKALLKVVRKWEDDGAAQVAAAQALARCGGDGAIKPLTAVLKKSEKQRERRELASAINAALRALTGQELEGYRFWQAYRRR
jgi:predicted esterase